MSKLEHKHAYSASFEPIKKTLRPSGAKLAFLCTAAHENSFWRFTGKRKQIDLKYVISANINMHIPHLLSPITSLYDLHKLSYNFGPFVPNMCRFGTVPPLGTLVYRAISNLLSKRNLHSSFQPSTNICRWLCTSDQTITKMVT